MEKWISVNDKLPEPNKPVLIYINTSLDESRITITKIQMVTVGHMTCCHTPTGLDEGAIWYALVEDDDCCLTYRHYPVLYWMPFPEPPGEYTGER